jgi:Ca2+-binding RTX toxin-like protein
VTVRTSTIVVPLAVLSTLLLGQATAPAAGFAATTQAVPLRCDGRIATIVGTPGDDSLQGTRRTDVIVGLAGSDRILGLGGNDVLCGGEGRDRIEGGPGDDRVFGQLDRRVPNGDRSSVFDMYGDRVLGGPGDDLVDPGFDTRPAVFREADVISFENSGSGVKVDLARGRASGQGKDRLVTRGAALVTTRFADIVTGTSRRDDIGTGDGDDQVRGRGGADLVLLDGPALIGRGGDDIAHLGGGQDQSDSLSGSDRVNGQGGGDIIVDRGRSGDFLNGGVGRDSVEDHFVDEGEQRLVGGPVNDPGRDELSLTGTGSGQQPGEWDMSMGVLTLGDNPTAASVVLGFEESILPSGVAWVVNGSQRGEAVFVFDGSADVIYHGNGGRDTFFGARGDDIFDGGAGRDYAIDMGPGQDVCIDVEKFGAGHGCEVKQ